MGLCVGLCFLELMTDRMTEVTLVTSTHFALQGPSLVVTLFLRDYCHYPLMKHIGHKPISNM